MPMEVELGVPLRNPSSQSDYSQSLRKALRYSNQLAQRNLDLARSRQAANYSNKSMRDWEPFPLDLPFCVKLLIPSFDSATLLHISNLEF